MWAPGGPRSHSTAVSVPVAVTWAAPAVAVVESGPVNCAPRSIHSQTGAPTNVEPFADSCTCGPRRPSDLIACWAMTAGAGGPGFGPAGWFGRPSCAPLTAPARSGWGGSTGRDGGSALGLGAAVGL